MLRCSPGARMALTKDTLSPLITRGANPAPPPEPPPPEPPPPPPGEGGGVEPVDTIKFREVPLIFPEVSLTYKVRIKSAS